MRLLDEALCEIQQWAEGREIKSVLYKERNSLTEKQKQGIMREIDQMRRVLCELRDGLELEPEVRSAASSIRASCSGLWEHVAELKAKHLKRYGEVPTDLEAFLEPRTTLLIEGLVNILDAIKPRKHSEQKNNP